MNKKTRAIKSMLCMIVFFLSRYQVYHGIHVWKVLVFVLV